jgi:S1-C subfamily serine protease
MFEMAVTLAAGAVFPIFHVTPLPTGQTQVGVAGTGFFVDSRGTFATVAHAFDVAQPGTRFVYAGCVPDQVHPGLVDIIELARDDIKDICIGRVDIPITGQLELSHQLVPKGRSVCVAGYPFPQITSDAPGNLNLGNVRRYLQPAMVLDYTKSAVGGSHRVHEGFVMTEFSLFGMSGGPVIDVNGVVVGMQAAVSNPRVSVAANGRKISVENAIAIRADHIHALLARTRGAQPATAVA